MSMEALTWALGRKGISQTDKLVLIAIANFADQNGVAWPSRKLIAGIAMVSPRTVTRCIADLEAAGLLTSENRTRPSSGQTSNLYRLACGPTGLGDGGEGPDDDDGGDNEGPPPLDRMASGVAKPVATGMATSLSSQEPSLNRQLKKKTPVAPKGAPTPGDALKAFEAYNATALRCALQQAGRLTPDRQRRIIARLKDYGLDGWMTALANLERSSFLRGKNDRNWRANLDFLLQASSFSKVHDGSYGNGAHAAPIQSAPPRRSVPDILSPEYDAYMARMMRELGVQTNG